MHRMLKQIAPAIDIDKEKDFVTISIQPKDVEPVVYKFNMERGTIIILNNSHAPIAAISGKRIKYKSNEIMATNNAFKWLGIECTVEYDIKKRDSSAELKDGVISFFP